MSSQNYLSNVFRQVYTYSNGQFVPSINLSNVSKITADSLTVTTLSLGGSNDNLYFGEGAGSIDSNSANNTAIGVEAAGFVSNVNNSVFLGRSAGLAVSNAESVISIGVSTKGAGTSNIYIGNGTGSSAAGSISNVYIGHSIDTASAVSNQLRIGQDGNTLLAGDFNTKWLGIGTLTPTNGNKLDVSGGANVTGDLTVAGNISAGSIGTSAISGPRTRMQDGSASYPSYSFINDTSLGLYNAGGHSMGFANRGIQVMCISGTRVGINTPNPSTTLEVNGDISANSYNGPDGTVSLPKYSFSSARNTGIYLDSGKLSFAVNGVKQLEITSNGVVDTNDVGIYSVLRDANVPVDYDISGGNIRIIRTLTTSNIVGTASASNSIGGVTLSNSNVSGVVTTTTSNVLTNGYLRNALIPTQFDISGGNISNSGATRSSNFVTGSTSSNSIGGVTLSNNNIALSGAIVGSTENTSNSIGGVTLSNENIAMWGSIIGLADYASNRIGGVTLSNHDIAMSGTIIGSTANTSNQIGGVTLSNNNIAMSGNIVGSTANTSNQIGGVTLSNNNIAMSGTIIGSTANTSNRIGGVTLSNYEVTDCYKVTASNFIAPVNGESIIGGFVMGYGEISGNTGLGTTMISTEYGKFGTLLKFPMYPARVEVGDGGYPGYVGYGGIAFQMAASNTNSNGGYRHFIVSRHDAAGTSSNNGIDFYTNTSTNYLASVYPTLGNRLAMSITSAGVGVGTSNPTFNLDVSGNIRSTAASSNNIGGVTLSNTNIIAVGNIGIKKQAPAYALDISANNVSSASINMNTWPRSSTSLTYKSVGGYGGGYGLVANLCTLYNDPPIVALNPNVGTVTFNDNFGTYFTCLKTGIWNISCVMGSDGGGFACIDVVTDITDNLSPSDNDVIGRALMLVNSVNNIAPISYTGYIQSNANVFYKFKTSSTNFYYDFPKLQISFICEQP